jgi:hypothetical protein
MPASFAATGSFALPKRRLFVVHGTIASGVVRKGMKMCIRLNSQMAISIPVDEVEFLDGRERHEIALCSRYESDDELEMLTGLSIVGESIDVVDS